MLWSNKLVLYAQRSTYNSGMACWWEIRTLRTMVPTTNLAIQTGFVMWRLSWHALQVIVLKYLKLGVMWCFAVYLLMEMTLLKYLPIKLLIERFFGYSLKICSISDGRLYLKLKMVWLFLFQYLLALKYVYKNRWELSSSDYAIAICYSHDEEDEEGA